MRCNAALFSFHQQNNNKDTGRTVVLFTLMPIPSLRSRHSGKSCYVVFLRHSGCCCWCVGERVTALTKQTPTITYLFVLSRLLERAWVRRRLFKACLECLSVWTVSAESLRSKSKGFRYICQVKKMRSTLTPKRLGGKQGFYAATPPACLSAPISTHQHGIMVGKCPFSPGLLKTCLQLPWIPGSSKHLPFPSDPENK